MEGVASYSHCIQDDSHGMWDMLTGNEVACSCLYMHSAVDVCTSKGMCEQHHYLVIMSTLDEMR